MWLALFLALAALAVGDEAARDAQIAAALDQAETAAATGQWSIALEAGARLRALCRERHGEEHPDTALAELFLGEVRDQLGDRALAEAHFRRALALQQKVLRPDAPELVTTLTRLGAWLKDAQRYDEAVGALRQAVDLQARIGGADEIDTAVASVNLARVLRLKGDLAGAAALLEKSVAIQRRVLGDADIETIAGWRELAQVHESEGKLAEAERNLGERVAAIEAHFGAQSAELAAALAEWGRVAERQEHFVEAEPRYRRALNLSETLFPADAPAVIARLAQLGDCLRNLGRFDEAEPLLQRALEARLRTLGPEHLGTAESHRQLGSVRQSKRDFPAALESFAKALSIRDCVLGPADPATLESLGDLGDLHWRRGAYDEAASLLETRRERVEAAFGAASEEAAAAWHGLAVVYESARRWPEATQAALRSLALAEERLGPADAQTTGELLLLSRICTASGEFGPALTTYARLATWFRQQPEASPTGRAELLRQYAIALLRSDRADEAAPVFQESRRVQEAAFGPLHAATLRSLADLWTFFDETRQPALALEAARELAARSETALGADQPATIAVFERLAQLCLTLGDRGEAARWFRRSVDGTRSRFGVISVEVHEALARVASLCEGARDFARAVAWRTERLWVVERKSGRDSAPVAEACGELAWCYFRQGDLPAARGMFERQLALLSKSPESEQALTVLARLGDVAVAARDWPWAVKEREQLAAGCARRFGAEHAEHGRALLLLGEALLASGAEARAERTVREARRLLHSAEARDALASRAACALARLCLRRGEHEEAKRWMREALAGLFSNEEPLAEAFSLLGEDWARAGDDASAESALTGALMILTQAAGDRDEHTLALLQRLAALRLRLVRPGAVALLERALTASEALHGTETAATAEALGWLALARVEERQFGPAHAAAQRMLAILGKTGGDAGPRVAQARELEAWTGFCAADPAQWEVAAAKLASLLLERWRWLEPLSGQVARSFAQAGCALELMAPAPAATKP